MSTAEPSKHGPAAPGAVRDVALSKSPSVPPAQELQAQELTAQELTAQETAERVTRPQVQRQQVSEELVSVPEVTVPEVTVQLNGEAQRVPSGLNLEALLRHLGHQPRLVVVEYNGTILPRALWADQRVGESDVLEVVTIVGGGS